MMDPAMSSKVTVEYFDPSGLFPLISSGLLARLPLRNLHWKSPSRPLRSISSLHVDLVPHREQQSSQGGASTASSDGSNRAKDSGAAPGGDDAAPQSRPSAETGTTTSKGPIKERRHQIPGLRQTPYLKIYLLRCDDNETYKASSRKLLREWIKVNASQNTSFSNAQENHDAFEWLIVHVVLPNTFAASQPTTAGPSSGMSGPTTEKPGSSSSRWPGKGSSTVLEKVKADFNGSSKSSPDRVAQIRLHKTDIPPHLLPDISQSGQSSLDEDQEDQEAAWSDLISKLKSLILASFNLRVIQYEEDIRQRDARRSLPGWNFCTFFILKEGLARGFESVGLLEDALVVYDELSVSLDMTAREVYSDEQGLGGTTFLKYTEDLRLQVEAARLSSKRRGSASSPAGKGDDERRHKGEINIPLDETRKRYRDLILSNKISLFDLRCYLFARQMSLLLRQANAWLSRADLISRLRADQSIHLSPDHEKSSSLPGRAVLSDDSEDLLKLAQLSERGVGFIPSVARIMRADLCYAVGQSRVEQDPNTHTAREGQPMSRKEDDMQTTGVIDNLVNSWIFSVSQQILAETYTKSLPSFTSPAAETNASNVKLASNEDSRDKMVMQEPKTMIYPARRSSLVPHQPPQAEFHSEMHPSPGAQKSDVLKTGMENLAYHRAELYLLERSALKQLGHIRGWAAELGRLDASGPHTHDTFEDVSLDDSDASPGDVNVRSDDTEGDNQSMGGIENQLLCKALDSRDTFYRLYEILTDNVLSLFTIAKKTESIEATLTDLAILRYQLGDYATAASHFSRLAPSYVDKGWNSLGSSMLRIYAQCLKKLDRKEDYVRILLELIARAVVAERRNMLRSQGGHSSLEDSLEQAEEGTDERADYAASYLQDLEAYSKDLPNELTAPLNRYIGDIQVEPYSEHFPDRDGFRVQLKLRHLLRQDIKIEKLKVRMVAAEGSRSQEIWLENDEMLVLKQGVSAVWLGTHVMAPGSYVVDKLIAKFYKIIFAHETLLRPSDVSPARLSTSSSRALVAVPKQPLIRCYPRLTGLEAKLELPRHVVLGENRSIEVCITSGRNDILQGQLQIRSASAGLRLKTAEAEVESGSVEIRRRPQPGVLELGNFSKHSLVRVRIPYALEQELPEISVKLEVDYRTKLGDFSYFDTCNVPIVLPLRVNVQDIFRANSLFSKFTISTASSVPLRVLKSELKGSDMLKVQPAAALSIPLLVFPKQPAALIYKISQVVSASERSISKTSDQKRLGFVIEYSCLDEEVKSNVKSVFTTALVASQYEGLSRLLLPHLLSRLRSKLSSPELVTVGLLGEVDLGPFENLGWDECLRALPPNQRADVREWLEAWHQENRVIQLRDDWEKADIGRKITIPVEVPRMQVVHTANLILMDNQGRPLGDDSTVTVGQTLAAELRIRHTRAWDFVTLEQTADAPVEFIYDIQTKPDTWLIGGRRRAQFSAKENEEHIFPVMLLPLQPGHLLLPTVEIKPFISFQPRAQTTGTRPAPPYPNTAHDRRSPSSPAFGADNISPSPQERSRTDSPRAGPGRSIAPITCETDNRSRAQTILVLQDVKSTTVSLDFDVPGHGTVLIKTESRVSVP